MRAWISLSFMVIAALALTWSAANYLEQRSQAQAAVKGTSDYVPPPVPR